MKGKFTIEVDKRITEQNHIETCLNMKHSGYDWKVPFFFYAMGKRWNGLKLFYYLNLLDDTQILPNTNEVKG